MWRSSHHLLKKTITSAARTSHGSRPVPAMDSRVGSSSGSTRMVGVGHHRSCTTPGSASGVGCRVGSNSGSGQKMGFGSYSYSYYYCSTSSCNGEENKNVNNNNNNGDFITHEEAKRLMRLVNVEELKWKLGMENNEVIEYNELLKACTKMGVAKTHDEAVGFAKVLDDAGVILLFRDKVYLHPDKVVDEIRKAVPLALRPEDDPTIHELKNLQEKKDKIDELAHKQVRRILWTGLGAGLLQVGLFFRLTFWEFSWDVMEPIAFFTTTTGIVIGYAYFLVTSRDPSYQDVLKRLFLSRQRKLIKKNNFDIQRFVELQKKIKLPVNSQASMKHRLGVELEPEDLLHGY